MICIQTYLKRHMNESESSKFIEKVIGMKAENYLNTEQLSHLEKMGTRKEKVNWKDTMGTNGQMLKSARGGIRKKKRSFNNWVELLFFSKNEGI